MSRNRTVLAVAIVLVLAAAGVYYLNSKSQGPACTLEAKICPDGSYVGRTGPNCEFAECPPLNNLWETFTDRERGDIFPLSAGIGGRMYFCAGLAAAGASFK